MDADRKLCTFKEWYQPMYSQKSCLITCLFDFTNPKKFSDGYKLYLYDKEKIIPNIKKCVVLQEKQKLVENFIEKNELLLNNKFYPFRLSGDADYELLDENGNKNPQMHMFPNFSLMPVTGNMQIIKRNRELKSFIKNELGNYYESKDIELVPYLRWGKQYKDEKKNEFKQKCEKEALKAFLDLFDNLDEYCENLYFLSSKDIIDKSISDYWKYRKAIAKECGVCSEILGKNISSDIYN